VELFVAAQALALDLPLVTANMREFSRVRGLRIENWVD
jgi:tRNA(fMet)-specific endonuclease VapC